jgi:hypothetical protein
MRYTIHLDPNKHAWYKINLFYSLFFTNFFLFLH